MTKLSEKILQLMNNRGEAMMDTWEIANALYDSTMDFPNPRNGAIISNIIRAATKDDRLTAHDHRIYLNYP